MKFLLVEHWGTDLYAAPLQKRLQEMGHDVYPFKEHEFFDGRPVRWLRLEAKAEHKFKVGPRVAALNAALVMRCLRLRPDVVFVFRGDLVWPETIRALKRSGAVVIVWNNDNPLSNGYRPYVWRHFRRSLLLFDRVYAYRQANVDEFRRIGCKRVSLLRSFYDDEKNFPLENAGSSRYSCDVCFIGHWEDDGRDRFVSALMRERDIDFRLYGTLWDRSPIYDEVAARFGVVSAVYADYNLAINSAKVALVFLSGLNRDTYTRRCFEIPAAGTFMLAQHSDDLSSLFSEAREADFFRTPSDLVTKVRHYLANPQLRVAIARFGRERLLRDGHEARDRAKQIVDDLLEDLRTG